MTTTMRMNNNSNAESKRRPGRSSSGARHNGRAANRPAAMSAPAMGRALVLLATSCAAFRSGGGSSIAQQRRTPLAGSAAERSSSSAFVQHRSSPTPMARDDSAISMMSANDDNQIAMDEYLDYVEKRNFRLRQTGGSGAVSGPALLLGLMVPRSQAAAAANVMRKVTTTTPPSSPLTAPISALVVGVGSSPRIAALLSRTRLSSGSSIAAVNRIRRLVFGNVQRVTTAVFVPSVRNLLSLQILDGLGGFSVSAMAMILVLSPLLRGALVAQG